jgi:hypothetical protein
MPQHWLKPLGITDPPTPMPNDWTAEADLDQYSFMTGPATHTKPPPIGRGDLVLFHAVIHARLFGQAVVIGGPAWKKDPEWGERWPWVYPVKVERFVPRIEDGPKSSGVIPKKAIGRLQAGGDFARLDLAAYEAALDALCSCRTVQGCE